MGLIKWAAVLVLGILIWDYVPKLLAPKLAPVVEGFFHPKFRRVAETIRRNVESGKEEGGAFAVYHRGDRVIDMWWGYADAESGRRWTEDVMTLVYSATKSVAGITIAKMVDKGWLEYEKPVANYWPEFAQNGKEKITVSQLLSHQAGLISLGRKIPIRMMRDNRKEFIKLLEESEPAWKPGTAYGYHGITFGMFVDTLAEKADPKHRNMTQIFKEEIALPYGIDFHIGLPKSLMYRMARGHDPSDMARLVGSLTNLKSFHFFLNMMFYPESNVGKAFNIFSDQTGSINDPDLLNIGMSSFLGMGTARGLAMLYSYVAMGGRVGEKQLFSAKTLKMITTPMTEGNDQVLNNMTNSFGHGTAFKENPYEKYKGQMWVGHPGYGGQVGFADPTNQLSVAYVTNYRRGMGMWDDPRYLDLEEALYDCFHDYIKSKDRT